MTILPNDGQIFSPFLPSTQNIPEEDDRLKVFLVDRFSNMADVINDKKIGSFTQGVVNYSGNKFAYDVTSKVRSGFQYLARIKSYPASGTITVSPPPNITQQFAIFNAWGVASKPPSSTGAGDGSYITYVNAGNPNISYTFTDTLITITSTLGAGFSGFFVVDFIYDGS
jgi:hypothetical protein